MGRHTVLTLLTALMVAVLPSNGAAQATGQGTGNGAAVESEQMPGGGAVSAQGSSGLPDRSAPPRTLRAHWHVYLAFAATWLLLFGYALVLGRRFGRLEAEIQQVRNR